MIGQPECRSDEGAIIVCAKPTGGLPSRTPARAPPPPETSWHADPPWCPARPVTPRDSDGETPKQNLFPATAVVVVLLEVLGGKVRETSGGSKERWIR